MRMIERSTAFKRDYKRIRKVPRYRKDLDLMLSDILNFLLADKVLPEKYLDHVLSSNWCGYRECHIKPNLLLIYSKPDQSTLRLARLGSRSK